MSFNFGSSGGFNFGQTPAASSGQPIPATSAPAGLFGQPAAAQPNNLFGASTQATQASVPAPAFGGFGGGGNTKREASGADAGTGGKKPAFSFGGPSTSTLGSAASAPSLFGTPAKPPGSNLFGNSTTPAAPPPLFGNVAAATSTTPASAPPPLFGAAPAATASASSASLFGAAPASGGGLFGTTAQPPASKPTFSFGAPASTAPASTPAAPSGLFSQTSTQPPAGGIFGAKPPTSTGQAPATTPAPLSFGAPAASTSSTPTPLLFGAAPSTSTPSSSAAPTTTSAPLSFKPPATTAPAASAPALSFGAPSSTSTSTLSFGKPTTTPSATLATNPTTVAPTPSLLKGKTLEEIVNGWSAELEERTRDFGEIAGEVREWDRVLRDNGEKISSLYAAVLPLSPLQTQISSSLGYVESQQKDLAAILDSYEAQIGDLVDQSSTSAGWRGNTGQAEKERERAYTLATSLSNSLDTTSSSLSALIQTLNSLSPSLRPGAAQSVDDPLTQIAAILNAHLGSLKWIESTTDNLKNSVRDLEGRVGEVKARSPALASSTSRLGTPVRGQSMGSSRR